MSWLNRNNKTVEYWKNGIMLGMVTPEDAKMIAHNERNRKEYTVKGDMINFISLEVIRK